MEIVDHLRASGIADTDALLFWISKFTKNPAAIFQITPDELKQIEKLFDSAFDALGVQMALETQGGAEEL